MKLSDLKPDEQNANRGTDRGREAIRESIRRLGAGRSIVLDKHGSIIAGNKTAEGAAAVGLEDVLIVQTNGEQLVAVQRMDLEIDDARARELAIADNRTSELSLSWDVATLRSLTNRPDVVIAPFFREDELKALEEGSGDAARRFHEYTTKIDTPVYTPKLAAPPPLELLVDASKADDLAKRIDDAPVTDAEKAFLRRAAQRHVVFDYRQIAEYYCHASAEMQRLMEASALVIIDFDDAVANGYVVLSAALADLYGQTYGDA